ncbi:large ribosomal subunit protein bL35c [Rhododendron vialii]|uniref:large ribosomal subunit protein bL35c n=1 Tax=Rhododendron vialii TaxID=182163 RepID=UPI00265E5F88|nr:large ribosomal subunit protein bL35c [Rhododendron vialii]XP_058207023.1 large ribosomal subunit protein bL35c [Rhododendron vialii]
MTTMASSTAFCISFKLSPSSSSSTATRSSFRSPLSTVHFSHFTNKTSLTLTSSHTLSGFAPLLPQRIPTVASPTRNPPPLTVVCAKGYKMKTHKASAKRFRVTGSGKIMRRKCGKQHLLGKKNAKRRNRLSKSVQVDRSDYNNVIGALPYLKVNRKN